MTSAKKVSLMVRVTEGERKLYSDAAYKNRMDVSAWVREVLGTVAKHQLEVKDGNTK